MADYPYDLGTYRRPVTTESTYARIWFHRGLIWSYAFNHEEAVVCFERAIVDDPDCVLAYWGLAYALGPNYNKPWELFDQEELTRNLSRAYNAVFVAKDRARTVQCSPVEKALIWALQARYQRERPDSGRSGWNADFAKRMEEVHQQHSEDLDVAAIYADALMNLTPWSLWDLRTGQPRQGTKTLEAKAVLERALSQPGGTSHPGLLHLYIHLMEMSTTPEKALNVADHLRGLVPDAGHLHHMPTHIDILCGHYRDAIMSNTEAIRADEKFLNQSGATNFYSLYRCHDYHFRIYAALFAGQYKVAMDTVERLEKSLPEALLRIESPPMADWLEGFLSMRIHVLVRFGKWYEIIHHLDLPSDPDLYCVTTAMVHYAKGVAFAVTGNIAEADEARSQLHTAAEHVPASRTLFNNTCQDILTAAKVLLDGELEYRRGDIEGGFEHLRWAVRLSDALPYDEPWGWMQPPRHAYGALLLEQGRVEEALTVYAEDLGLVDTLPRALQHPNNIWALSGYHECLIRLGRSDEARFVKKTLDVAAAGADVPVVASCFCRRTDTLIKARMA